MNKKKLALVIVCTLLAMALVAVALIIWLVSGGQGGKPDVPGQTTTAPVSDDPTESGNEETVPSTDVNVGVQEPSVGVDVETGNTGNSGNSNSGNSGNTGNTGNSGNNNEIDFDDLLGNG